MLPSEEGFHGIYAGFFPWGEESYHPSICSYSHYLFSLMDEQGTGAITFGVMPKCMYRQQSLEQILFV